MDKAYDSSIFMYLIRDKLHSYPLILSPNYIKNENESLDIPRKDSLNHLISRGIIKEILFNLLSLS